MFVLVRRSVTYFHCIRCSPYLVSIASMPRNDAKGYRHQHWIDFTNTFSPVIKPTIIRIMVGLAVNNSWSVTQIDVNTTFLQGHLKEEVFMCQPSGFSDSNNPTKVCKMRKALYVLKLVCSTTTVSSCYWFQKHRGMLFHC